MTEATIFISGIMLRTIIGETFKLGFKKFLASSERRTSIFQHYLEQARGKGHDKEWLDCHEGQCANI